MIITLHIIAVIFSLSVAVYADHMGYTWFRGKVLTLNAQKLHKIHTMMWIGLGALLITGFGLFWPAHQYLLTRPQFLVKMSFVAALIINGLVIGTLLDVTTKKKYQELTTREKIPLFISGVVSTASWIGALIAAFFIYPD
jgi:hypothetical protein